MRSDHNEQVLRLQLSSRPYALARVVQILSHRRIEVRSLVLSSMAGESAGASLEVTVARSRDHERAVRFLARCIDVVSIEPG